MCADQVLTARKTGWVEFYRSGQIVKKWRKILILKNSLWFVVSLTLEAWTCVHSNTQTFTFVEERHRPKCVLSLACMYKGWTAVERGFWWLFNIRRSGWWHAAGSAKTWFNSQKTTSLLQKTENSTAMDFSFKQPDRHQYPMRSKNCSHPFL
jgi:hypothetical protein